MNVKRFRVSGFGFLVALAVLAYGPVARAEVFADVQDVTFSTGSVESSKPFTRETGKLIGASIVLPAMSGTEIVRARLVLYDNANNVVIWTSRDFPEATTTTLSASEGTTAGEVVSSSLDTTQTSWRTTTTTTLPLTTTSSLSVTTQTSQRVTVHGLDVTTETLPSTTTITTTTIIDSGSTETPPTTTTIVVETSVDTGSLVVSQAVTTDTLPSTTSVDIQSQVTTASSVSIDAATGTTTTLGLKSAVMSVYADSSVPTYRTGVPLPGAIAVRLVSDNAVDRRVVARVILYVDRN